MEIGTSYTIEKIVENEHTAHHYGSGSVFVYATPCMILHMEMAASLAVAPLLQEGITTVGTVVNIEHLAATPVGMKIKATAVLKEIDERRLVFIVEAYDEKGIIGRGTHERFIINTAKFMERTNAKLQ
ncbi:MAG: thioesterase family protein [Defluviitaleaceae bacterium]|nr:thioesterase family protein [Defluviitaleaceae bacterium]